MITYTNTYFGPSQQNVNLVRQISLVGRKMSLTADPSAIQSLLIIPGTTNIAEVMPFWRAVLEYEPRHDCPFAHLSIYAAKLPQALFHEFDDRGHQFHNDLSAVPADIFGLSISS